MSIKEKTDIIPVVSDGPLERVQVDLVDLLSYAQHNNGYTYILTMIDVFSRYVWVIPLKDKKGGTVHNELKKVFMNFGPPNILQADNGSEFITDVLKQTCETLEVFILFFFFFILHPILIFYLILRHSSFMVVLAIRKVKEKLKDLIKLSAGI